MVICPIPENRLDGQAPHKLIAVDAGQEDGHTAEVLLASLGLNTVRLQLAECVACQSYPIPVGVTNTFADGDLPWLI